jgi:hypothetical protein
LTIPYNPKQNGVTKRKNMAIVGAMRSMLHDHALPFFLWAEACSIALYLQKMSPHRALGERLLRRPSLGVGLMLSTLSYLGV